MGNFAEKNKKIIKQKEILKLNERFFGVIPNTILSSLS